LTINGMNTSTNTNQTHDTATSTTRTMGIGFLRRTNAGALLAVGIAVAGVVLATAIGATAVGLAATSHADDGTPAPNTESPISAPAPVAPWLPFADPGCRRPLYFFDGRVHCG
jgi:hypothetical protein